MKIYLFLIIYYIFDIDKNGGVKGIKSISIKFLYRRIKKMFVSKSSEKYKSIVPVIVEQIAMGENKKAIANKYKVDYSFVMKVYNDNKLIINEIRNNKVIDNVPNIAIATTEVEEEDNIVEKKKYKKLTPELKKEIIDTIISMKDVKYQDISEAFDVSVSSISRIAKEAGINRQQKREDNNVGRKVNNSHPKKLNYDKLMDELKEDNKTKETKIVGGVDVNSIVSKTIEKVNKSIEIDGYYYDIAPVQKKNNIAEFGLIDERHDLPIDDYIYPSLESDDIANFEQLYQTAFDKLKTVNKDCTVIVYCTGLQQALGAVFRACLKLNLSLILKHYDPFTKDYTPQNIIGDTDVSDCNYQFNKLQKSSSVYTYNCTIDDLSGDDIFCVNYFSEERVTGSSKKKEEKINIFCKNSIDAFRLFGEFSLNIQDVKKDISIFIRKATMNSSLVEFDKIISKTYNFKN